MECKYKTKEGKDNTTIEIRVESEKPAVVDDVRQVALQVYGIECADRTRSQTKQSALEWEVDLSVHASNVAKRETSRLHIPDDYGNTGKNCTKSSRFAKQKVTRRQWLLSLVLYEWNHRDSEWPRYLIEGHFDILQTQVAHSHHQTIKDRKWEDAQSKMPWKPVNEHNNPRSTWYPETISRSWNTYWIWRKGTKQTSAQRTG